MLLACALPSATAYLDATAAAARLWTVEGHAPLAALDLDPAHLAPATHDVQRLLMRHQFRPAADCAAAAYLVGGVSGSGLGSQLHVATFHLALALHTNRIFMWHPAAGGDFATSRLCAGRPHFGCFFSTPSNCTPPRGADVVWLGKRDVMGARVRGARTRVRKDLVPQAALTLLAAAAGARADWRSRGAQTQWWRGQALAFLARLAPPALDVVAALRRREATTHVVAPAIGPAAAAAPGLRGVPLPPGVVSVHVRHGDKGLEMRLEQWAAYAARVPRAAALMAGASTPAGAALPAAAVAGRPFAPVLLTTDDPRVVAAAAAAARHANATVAPLLYFDVPRAPRGTLHGRGKLVAKLGDAIIHEHLAQIIVTLEADAWIGTRESNIDRMQDELRCVWVPKCGDGYAFHDMHSGAMMRGVVY